MSTPSQSANPRHNWDSARLLIFFLVAVVGTAVAAGLLGVAYGAWGPDVAQDASQVFVRYRRFLSPKPTERFVFLTLALVVPVLCFGWTLQAFRRTATPDTAAACYPSTSPDALDWRVFLLSVLSAALLLLPFTAYDFASTAELPWGISRQPVLVWLAALGAAVLWHRRADSTLAHRAPRIAQRWTWAPFLVALVLQAISWRVVGENSIFQSPIWTSSADAVFYAMGQVVAGRTLLIDLPSQYGLFPEFLLPIFQWVDLSILSFSVTSAVLQIVSLAALFSVVQDVIRDTTIKLVSGLALIMLTFGTTFFLGGAPDLYFQYWPIRFFWPALAVLAVHRHARRPGLLRSGIVSLTAALGALWNAETGIVICIAFAGLLVAQWVVLHSAKPRNTRNIDAQRRILLSLVLHLTVIAVVVAAMLIWLKWRSGGNLHWNWLFGSQMTFYGLGFMMLPLPLSPHPWMPVLGIYLLGLLVACRLWAAAPRTRHADLLAFMALLGLGLFVYYEGRSHAHNLVSVAWPAMTLVALLSDRTARAIRAGMLPRAQNVLPIAGLSVLIFVAAGLVAGVPRLLASAANRFETRHQPDDLMVADELAFIRKNLRHGEDCLILSHRQGLYHAATGSRSPISGPGLIEIILQADRDAFAAQLRTRPISCMFVGILTANEFDLGLTPADMPAGLVPAGLSPLQSMVLLRRPP